MKNRGDPTRQALVAGVIYQCPDEPVKLREEGDMLFCPHCKKYFLKPVLEKVG